MGDGVSRDILYDRDELREMVKFARRAGAIEALEKLECTDPAYSDGRTGKTCIEHGCASNLWCPRCRALAALKGGAE